MDKKTVSNAVVISLVFIIVFIYTAKLKEDNRNLQQINNNQLNQLAGKDEIIKKQDLKYDNLNVMYLEDTQKLKKQVELVTEDNNEKMEFLNKLKGAGYDIPSRIGRAPDTHLETNASRGYNLENMKTLRRIPAGSYKDKPETITYTIDDLGKWESTGRLWVTGYTPTPEETDGDPSKTAYGGLSTPGFTIAANPKYWPKGTKLYNAKLGFGVVDDTGSAVNGREHIDFMFADKKIAYQVTGYYNFKIVQP